ncbi:lactonase family protein [Mariniflexile litorale]|uniref:Lactonase family protein n=1 Tax=Mariniflexile litorale TaxID=3045158 RepID=A0AAU7EJ84_9FLAO|nr:lactonase family protein [Mariniflexile sp. KMM 9835]MDQ8210968.1 lactonase family protein [Mariniflexile sp. KMM 9835]
MKIRLLSLSFSFCFLNCFAQNIPLYIGTYTDGHSEGIYKLQFNLKTGELSRLQLAIATENPSFITYSPNKKYLYAVSESLGGSVSSFKIQENGLLKFLNKVSSNGTGPCHISLNKQGNKAVVSNYRGGSASIYSIARDGKLNEASQIFDYNTTDIISHAHSAQFFRDELYIADLGMNALYQYKLKNNNYELATPSIFKTTENLGPRHFALTKNGQFIYIINEHGSSVTSVKKTASGFKQIDYDSTLDENYQGKNSCADIHLSKNEHYLYGSNRGENSIVVFKRNKFDGTIEKIQTVPVHGDWPRNFTLDPSGKFLLVANQKSRNISVFSIDTSSGTLTFLHDVKAPTPVCLLF